MINKISEVASLSSNIILKRGDSQGSNAKTFLCQSTGVTDLYMKISKISHAILERQEKCYSRQLMSCKKLLKFQ